MNLQTKRRIISATVFLLLLVYITLPLYKSSDEYIIRIESLDEYDMISTGFVYVGSHDCPGCVTLMPVVKQVSAKREISVSFIDYVYLLNNDIVSVEDINAISERFGIERIPMLLELVDGEVVASYTSDIFNPEGAENATEMLNVFYDGSHHRIMPVRSLVGVTTMLISVLNALFISVSILHLGKASTTECLILLLIIFSTLSLYYGGVYIDEHALRSNPHIIMLSWMNLLVTTTLYILHTIVRRKHEKNI